ncbi:MAG: putative Ig domain-containing protein [Acidobacteria bacterium]|nr:putative Ig domain-containing protein [Acidobacteriota bacterium]
MRSHRRFFAVPAGAGFPGMAVLACLLAATPVMAQDDVVFVTEALPDATKGLPYLDGDPPTTVFLQATGGFTPYNFELREGALPVGLELDSSGAIFGIPEKCENAVFRVMVRDVGGSSDLRTFLIQVSAPPNLVLPATFDPSVEAGVVVTLSLDMVNQGCETVAFHAESVDLGGAPSPISATATEGGSLASLMKMGAPVPRSIGRRSEPGRPRASGWTLDADGLLLDGEGNRVEQTRSPAPEGLTSPEQTGESVLYVNESVTPGEQERMERLGFTVVQALVPEALDLATLKAFDVLWLTAASGSIFVSADAVRQYVWEGGGVVIEQAQFSGFANFLPAGYEMFMFTPPTEGDNNTLAFTSDAASDPLTMGLSTSDLPTNFDTTFREDAGPRWTFLAIQADTKAPDPEEDGLEVVTLGTAAMGAGRFVYHSGNLGTFTSPSTSNGSDLFVTRVVESAASGTAETSCPWLDPGLGISDVRDTRKNVKDVEPFDITGETVALQLTTDTRDLLPGDYLCELRVLTDDSGNLEQFLELNLTVTPPVAPMILQDHLPHAEPGMPYGATLLSAGGTPPYTWALSGGSLPAGLILDPAMGTISGTPTETGLFSPAFTLTDSLGAFDQATLKLASGFVITTESLPGASIGQIYATPIFATGGVPPYSFTLDATVDLTLPADDPNSPAGQACVTTDLGGDVVVTDCDLPSMTYRIVFGGVPGYFTPLAMDVAVPAGGTTVVDAHYTLGGAIEVTTNLDEAFYSLTADTPLGEVDLLGAGLTTTFLELPPGDYLVAYAVVPGFVTPPEEPVTLLEGGSLVVSGTYVPILPPARAGEAVSDPSGGPAGREEAWVGVTGAVPRITPSSESEIGFGDGTLSVTVDAPGAVFRVIGNRPLTSMQLLDMVPDEECLADPNCVFAGTGAALLGRMATIASPVLAPGEDVSIVIVVQDSAGNTARRSYAPTVWDLPVLNSLVPASSGLGQELDLQILGAALRPSASISLGDGIQVEPGRFNLIGASGTFTEVVARVDSDTLATRRDLVYTDPDLADTAAGSVFRLDEAMRVFVDVNRIDLDGSGRVDGFDLAAVASSFGLSAGDPSFDPARDLNNDGQVDGEDLASLGVAFGRLRLTLEPADLPPPAATLGLDYSHTIHFVGGNLFIGSARTLSGDLPDGLFLLLKRLSTDTDTPQDSELLISGIPAETGSFTIRVQAVDAFFAIVEEDITVVVNP